jgi:hypothetical protein
LETCAAVGALPYVAGSNETLFLQGGAGEANYAPPAATVAVVALTLVGIFGAFLAGRRVMLAGAGSSR